MKPILLSPWAIISTPDPYLAPELRAPHLSGDAFGHPRFEDGKNITSSRIIGKDASDNIHTKSGSIYQLGDPATAYAEAFPDCRRRLLDSLPLIP